MWTDHLNFCLLCLQELSRPNVGTAIPERIIRHLMRSMGVVEEALPSPGLYPQLRDADGSCIERAKCYSAMVEFRLGRDCEIVPADTLSGPYS